MPEAMLSPHSSPQSDVPSTGDGFTKSSSSTSFRVVAGELVFADSDEERTLLEMKEDADVLEALQSHKDHIREQDHETSLIRHLQARDWNVGKAKRMLLEHLKWREGFGQINAENTDFSPALKTACWTSLGVSSNGEPVPLLRILPFACDAFRRSNLVGPLVIGKVLLPP